MRLILLLLPISFFTKADMDYVCYVTIGEGYLENVYSIRDYIAKNCERNNIIILLMKINVLKEFVIWDWSKGQYDWQYPLSVDGHFFSTSELTFFAELLDYKAPNSFEASLQPYQNIFSRRMGVCMNETRLLNVPSNIVQD